MYYNLSYLDLENSFVEKKLNLFFDYFRFVANCIGLIDDLPLENHLSLVEKIIFQIEHNPIHRVRYIDNYLKNPLLLQSDPLLKKFDAYEKLRPLVSEYNSCKAKKKAFEGTSDFKSALEELRDELSDKAFEYSLDAIIQKVRSAPVEGFIGKVAYHVNLLISEFLFAHRSRQDTFDVLEQILDSERFPYPAAIAGKGEEEMRKYFNQLSVKDHLEGINGIYRKKRDTNTFVCKVYDMGSYPTFEFKPRQVTFISKEKWDKIIGQDCWQTKRFEKFLNDQKEFILAYLPVSFYSFLRGSDGKVAAIDTIREELSVINRDLSTNGVVDTRDYLLLDSENKAQGRESSDIKKIGADSVTTLENNSVYVFLKARNNAAERHILEHESNLSAAKLSKRIADYWHYLETIITNAFPGEKTKVEDFLPSILLVNHLYQQESLAERYIEMGSKNLQGEPTVDELLAEKNYPFVNELADRFSSSNVNAQYYCDLKKRYRLVLTEAYEQRNAYQHAGYECEKAIIKLRHTLYRLIISFRWLILERADVPGEISFVEILTCLKEEGEQLCAS